MLGVVVTVQHFTTPIKYYVHRWPPLISAVRNVFKGPYTPDLWGGQRWLHSAPLALAHPCYMSSHTQTSISMSRWWGMAMSPACGPWPQFVHLCYKVTVQKIQQVETWLGILQIHRSFTVRFLHCPVNPHLHFRTSCSLHCHQGITCLEQCFSNPVLKEPPPGHVPRTSHGERTPVVVMNVVILTFEQSGSLRTRFKKCCFRGSSVVYQVVWWHWPRITARYYI